jgi:hypothetical protein
MGDEGTPAQGASWVLAENTVLPQPRRRAWANSARRATKPGSPGSCLLANSIPGKQCPILQFIPLP